MRGERGECSCIGGLRANIDRDVKVFVDGRQQFRVQDRFVIEAKSLNVNLHADQVRPALVGDDIALFVAFRVGVDAGVESDRGARGWDDRVVWQAPRGEFVRGSVVSAVPAPHGDHDELSVGVVLPYDAFDRGNRECFGWVHDLVCVCRGGECAGWVVVVVYVECDWRKTA